MRKPFISETHNDHFSRNGYVHVQDAIPGNDLQNLFPEKYLSFKSYRDYHFTSHDTPDASIKSDVIEKVGGLIDPYVANILKDYKPVVSSFHVKLPDSRSKLKIHQNPTFVDEFYYSSMVCWAPLHEVDERNGTVFIIPGTHRMFKTYRVANFTDEKWLDKIESKLIRKHKVAFKMSPGDLLFFDDAVFHGSFPNLSDKVRVSIAQVNIPIESQLLLCRKQGNEIQLFKVPDDFYERMSEPEYLKRNSNLHPLRTFIQANAQKQLKYSEFKSLYDYYF